MNVLEYRKYVVNGWTPVLTDNLDMVFREAYNGVWVMNGSILVGWSWKNLFMPSMSMSTSHCKRANQAELMIAVRHYQFRKYRRTASLIFVNRGVPMYLAETVAEYT